jgi:hypothetical protein
MPVRIDEADTDFYHVTPFAKRDLRALQELTWVGPELQNVDSEISSLRCLTRIRIGTKSCVFTTGLWVYFCTRLWGSPIFCMQVWK